MKRNILYIILIGLIPFFSACEDVIDLDLKNASPQIVIEAKVVNHYERQEVKISQTKSFSDDNSIIPISNAVITVKEDGGQTYSFQETSPGFYQSTFFNGKPGKKYTMQVAVNNKTYTAVSLMPNPVVLDSITVTELSFFGSTQKFAQVNYNDPGNVANQYNYVIKVNNEVRNSYFVESDQFNNGKKVTGTIFNDDPELKKDDLVSIDFQCIDLPIYRYFFALSQISGNGGPPTSPSNPDSNFNNGALGYFSAHTSQIRTVTIP